MKEVRLWDIDNETESGGIVLDDGNVICTCCGGLIENREISIKNCKKGLEYLDEDILEQYKSNDYDDCMFEIKEVFDYWLDLSDALLGDK